MKTKGFTATLVLQDKVKNNSISKRKQVGGFTLIELLVVISIIGLLSSVVLVALNSARIKGSESAIIQELTQFRNLYELAYSNSGDYSSLQTTTISTPCDAFNNHTVGFYCAMTNPPECSNVFGSSPVGIIANNPTALSLCNKIVNSSGYFYIGVNTNSSMNQKYSFAAYLPGQNKYMCMGSSKSNSIVSTVNYSYIISAPQDISAGCSANP